MSMEGKQAVRTFETGATRSSDAGRPDYEGYLSPLVIERFGEYMLKHQKQADGSLRASDNWQKGMPKESAIKGMWRHFHHLWMRHRGFSVADPLAAASIEEDLCAIWFNTQVYLHELLEERRAAEADESFLEPGDAGLESLEEADAKVKELRERREAEALKTERGVGKMQWLEPAELTRVSAGFGPLQVGDRVRFVYAELGGHTDGFNPGAALGTVVEAEPGRWLVLVKFDKDVGGW